MKNIAVNRKAGHDYAIEERHEAGLVLMGWEIKSLRAGKAQIADAYVLIKRKEAWLIGAHISPLLSASTHVQADPTRNRKLLLHRRQIDTLVGQTERRGYALIPLALYWKGPCIKLEIGLAKGKKQYDKRASEQDRDWERSKAQLFKKSRSSND